MSKLRRQRLVLCAALVGAGAFGTSLFHTPVATAQAANRPSLVGKASAQAEDEERGITEPSEMSELAFALPGVVIDVPVKLGNVVKKGQVLAQQDESVEKAELIIRMQEKQEALLQITAAEKEYATKKVAFERQDDLVKKNLTSKTEWETAKLDMEIAQVRGDLAKETVKKTDAQIEEQQIKIALKKLVAPYDGVVKKIDADRGETGDPQKPAMVIVSNNPLWVKIDMPSAKAKNLKLGQDLEVRYGDEAQVQKAKVIFLDPVVDAASDTRIVRLEMRNEANRESGLQVLVKLPPADRTSTAVAQPAAAK